MANILHTFSIVRFEYKIIILLRAPRLFRVLNDTQIKTHNTNSYHQFTLFITFIFSINILIAFLLIIYL